MVNRPESCEQLLAAGNAQRARAKWDQAHESYERALNHAIQAGDATAVAESILLIAHSLREAGQLEHAECQYGLAGTIAQLRGDDGRAGRSANGLGITLQELGRLDDAVRSYAHAAALAEHSGDQLTLAHVHQNLGTLENIRGRQESALGHYATSLEYFRRLENQRGVAGILNNLAMLYIDRRDFAAADQHLLEAFAYCEDLDDLPIETALHLTSAELCLAQNYATRARHHGELALRLADAVGQDRLRADALRLVGAVERAMGCRSIAENLLVRSISLSSASSNPLTEAEAWYELALLLQQDRRDKDALEALDRAYVIFQELDARQDLMHVKSRIVHTEAAFFEIVAAWGESIDSIDEYTRGHCHRVATYACMLGEAIGLGSRDLFWLRIGSLLHDVGKTEVPAVVLLKRGPLTLEERLIVEQHPLHGLRLLDGITLPGEVRAMVRSHHERWDGNGYPDGLVEEEIPLLARVLTFADVLDALTTARSYRAALPLRDAVSMMVQEGGQFDPGLMPEFLSITGRLEQELISMHDNTLTSFRC